MNTFCPPTLPQSQPDRRLKQNGLNIQFPFNFDNRPIGEPFQERVGNAIKTHFGPTRLAQCLCVTITFGLFFGTALTEEAFREWKSASGTVLRAKLTQFQRGSATLITPDNRKITVGLEQMSAEDQIYLKSWVPTSGANWKSVPLFDKGLAPGVAQERTYKQTAFTPVNVSEGKPIVLTPLEDRMITMARRGTLSTPWVVNATNQINEAELEILVIVGTSDGSVRNRHRIPLQNGATTISKLIEAGSGLPGFPASGAADVYVFAVQSNTCVSNILQVKGRVE